MVVSISLLFASYHVESLLSTRVIKVSFLGSDLFASHNYFLYGEFLCCTVVSWQVLWFSALFHCLLGSIDLNLYGGTYLPKSLFPNIPQHMDPYLPQLHILGDIKKL